MLLTLGIHHHGCRAAVWYCYCRILLQIPRITLTTRTIMNGLVGKDITVYAKMIPAYLASITPAFADTLEFRLWIFLLAVLLFPATFSSGSPS